MGEIKLFPFIHCVSHCNAGLPVNDHIICTIVLPSHGKIIKIAHKMTLQRRQNANLHFADL